MSSPLAAIGPPRPIEPLGGQADRPVIPWPTNSQRPVASATEPVRASDPDPEKQPGVLVEALSELPEFSGRELSIRREPDLNQVVVQVLDSETKEVIRQIPPDEVLSVLRQLQKTGLLLDKRG